MTNIVNHPFLEELIDKSKDELVVQCENLIQVLKEYKEETASLSDLVEAGIRVAKDLETERDMYVLVLHDLQNVLFEESLSNSEKYSRLNKKLNGMSLPTVESK